MVDGVPVLIGGSLPTLFISLNAEAVKTAGSEGTAGCLGDRHRSFSHTPKAPPAPPLIRSDRSGYRINPAHPVGKKSHLFSATKKGG